MRSLILASLDTEQEVLTPVQIAMIDRIIKGVLENVVIPRTVYHDRPLKRVRYVVKLTVSMDQYGTPNPDGVDRGKMIHSARYAKILKRAIKYLNPHFVAVDVEVKPKFKDSGYIPGD